MTIREILVEAIRVAGLMTDTKSKTIEDPENYRYISADEFFSKYPDQDRKSWETQLDPTYRAKKREKEAEQYRKNYENYDWMTPEEKAQYDKLRAEEQDNVSKGLNRSFKPEKYLKQLFQKKVDVEKIKSMIKIHWAPLNQLESFLQGKVNNKIELSAYLAKSIEDLGKVRWGSNTIGIIIEGHVTIAGRQDLGSDQYKEIAGKRGQQKYTSRPGQIDPSLNFDLSKHHEVLVDNWKIKEIVIPSNIPSNIDEIVKRYRIPFRRVDFK